MPRKKKVVTTEVLDGEEIEAEEKKAKEEKEEMEDDGGYRRRTKLPEIVQKILSGELTECPPEFQDWSMHIMRWAPKFTVNNEFELRTGRIRKIETLASYREIEEMVDAEHGGGTYHVNVMNADGNLATRRKFIIEGHPRVTREDMNHTESKYPGKEEKEEGKSKAEYWRDKKEEYDAMLEAQEARARYEKGIKDEEDDEETAPPPFYMPGSPMPGMGYGRPGVELVDKAKLEAEVEARVLEKYAREEERKELTRLHEEIKAMRDMMANPPKAQGNGFDMKDVFKMFTDMTTKLVESQKQNAPVAQSGEAQMNAFATMITTAMQNVNQASNNMMQNTMNIQNEIFMKTLKNAMAPAGEKDWKLELIEKGGETIKEFVGSIADANKSRHEVEKKKLDVIGAGKIRPMMLPRSMVKTQQPQPPQPQPPQPAQPQPQPAPGLPPDYTRQLMANAEKLQQAAIAAYLSGQSPAFFARKTLDIAGQEVTMWLMDNKGIETLRQLAFEQKGKAGVEEFDQYITKNPQAKKWVEHWLSEIPLNFRPVDAGGAPAEMPVQESPEAEEYIEIPDYEELPEIPEEALAKFVPPTPQENPEKNQENFQEAEEPPIKTENDNDGSPETPASSADAADNDNVPAEEAAIVDKTE